MPAINVVSKLKAIQYTGSNSAEIDATISNFSIDSESGGVLQFTSASTPYTANTNDWITFIQGAVSNVYSAADFNFNLIENLVAGDLAALDTRVGDLESGLDDIGGSGLRAAGSAVVPTLLLNASTTVAVNLAPGMPDSSYTPYAMVVGTVAIVGALNITGISVVDSDTVDVTVQNVGLASLSGANVLVTVTA